MSLIGSTLFVLIVAAATVAFFAGALAVWRGSAPRRRRPIVDENSVGRITDEEWDRWEAEEGVIEWQNGKIRRRRQS